MKIESSLSATDKSNEYAMMLEKAAETPGWDAFFGHFENITPMEKGACIEHFMQHMSHQIHHAMQRMIQVYKDMRYQG